MLLAMWAQTRQQAVSDRPGAVLSAPFATPLQAGAGAGASAPSSNTSTADPTTNSNISEPSTSTAPPPAGQLSSVPSSEGTFLLIDDLPAAGIRDSFASIVDDPFFLRFHAPDAPSALPNQAANHVADQCDDERQSWIPPRKESLSDTNPTPWVCNFPSFRYLCVPLPGFGAPNRANNRSRKRLTIGPV